MRSKLSCRTTLGGRGIRSFYSPGQEANATRDPARNERGSSLQSRHHPISMIAYWQPAIRQCAVLHVERNPCGKNSLFGCQHLVFALPSMCAEAPKSVKAKYSHLADVQEIFIHRVVGNGLQNDSINSSRNAWHQSRWAINIVEDSSSDKAATTCSTDSTLINLESLLVVPQELTST